MEKNVRFAPKTRDYLENLVTVLFQKEYFSWLDTSEKYVRTLIDDILTNLPNRLHKRAPEHYAKYGEDLHYVSFIKNKHTSWYVFFTKYQDENHQIIYLIRYIGNNHTEAQYL
ncbi:MAG: hypothetical protein LBE36_00290 [Flavobacteriaceae bacterium]|jgi:hypothetical protein|nr:hypothetical protein [Flavobacteriaceae bacterium]